MLSCLADLSDEPVDFRSFRIGLFGLDKLQNIDRTVQHLASALDGMSTGSMVV